MSVSKDGNLLRDYAYDAFGNRSSLADHGKGRNISYGYDALNRLISAEEGSLDARLQGNTVHMDYYYDNRGNLIREEAEGHLVHGYAYGAMNRLAKAWDDNGQEAVYRYNGLGQRTGKTVNGRDEDYLLDLTRPYHNLLGTSGEGKEQNFYFDWNVAAMEEKRDGIAGTGRKAYGGLHYYMQDELGSTLRVSGFMAGEGTQKGKNGCLNYGYDEFGNDLGKELEEVGIPNPYDGQGEEQPFGYTGYRYDGTGGTYFAQAREYQTKSGRFMVEDVVKGNSAIIVTLNSYSYCWNNPLLWVDLNGLWPKWLEGIYAHMQFQAEFMLMYDEEIGYASGENMYGKVNVLIVGGGERGGNGFADAVLYMNNTAYVYELKPERQYKNAFKETSKMADVKVWQAGIDQLTRYVTALLAFGRDATEGKREYIEPVLDIEAPFLLDNSKKIVYHMYSGMEGMVYYDIVEKGEHETEELPVLSKEEEEAYMQIRDKILQSILLYPNVLAGMIEDPEDEGILSSLFSPEAIIKSILGNMLPFGGGGGSSIACPI